MTGQASDTTEGKLDISSLLSEIHAAEQHHRRLLDDLHRLDDLQVEAVAEPDEQNPYMTACATGIGIGKIYVPRQAASFEEVTEQTVDDIKGELAAFKKARAAAVAELKDLSARIAGQVPQSDLLILDAHVQMVGDPKLVEGVEKLIKQGYAAPYALKQTITNMSQLFMGMDDQYLRERAHDVVDVGVRILRNLLRRTGGDEGLLRGDVVLMADILSPSLLLSLPRKHIQGIVLGSGSQTSHAVIMARSLAVPVITGARDLVRSARSGQMAVVDGDSTRVLVEPSTELIQRYRHLQETNQWLEAVLSRLSAVPAVTTDDRRVTLMANLGFETETVLLDRYGAEGIGLYRSEMHFLSTRQFPTQQEQENLYATIIKKMGKRPVIIRTLDIGGDKFLPYLDVPKEANPILGWRAIRASLDMPKVFKAQLGAIMKSAVHGDVSVMLPMIANVEEVVRTREIMAEIAEGFDREGVEYKRDMKVGIMIETPAAVRMAEALAKHADFFSIGSNDLIQFTLAVDRNNMRVAPLYDMFHPAVLQSIRDTLYAGQAAGIDVSLCGEAAGNPLMVPLLVGMGFRTLSMNPTAIHHIKRVILACSAADCRTMTDQLLSLDSGHEIRLRLIDLLIEIGVLFPR